MTKYVALLKKAIAHRQNPTAYFRRHIYIKARLAIDMKLLEVEAAEPVVKQHRAMLEKAIMEIETYYISETIMNELKKSGAIAPLDKSFSDDEDELDIEDNFDQLDGVAEKHAKADETLSLKNPARERIRDEMAGLPKQAAPVQKPYYNAQLVSDESNQSGNSGFTHGAAAKEAVVDHTAFQTPTRAPTQQATQEATSPQNRQNSPFAPYQPSMAKSVDKEETSLHTPNYKENARSNEFQNTDYPYRQSSLKAQFHEQQQSSPQPHSVAPVEELNIDSDSAIPNFSLQWNNATQAQHVTREPSYRTQPVEERPVQNSAVENTEEDKNRQSHIHQEGRERHPFEVTREPEEKSQTVEGSVKEVKLPDFLKPNDEQADQDISSEEPSETHHQLVDVALAKPDDADELEHSRLIQVNNNDALNNDNQYNVFSQNNDEETLFPKAHKNAPLLFADKKSRNILNIEKIAYVVYAVIIVFLCLSVYFLFSLYFSGGRQETVVEAQNTASVKVPVAKDMSGKGQPVHENVPAAGQEPMSKNDFRLLENGTETSAQLPHHGLQTDGNSNSEHTAMDAAKTELEQTPIPSTEPTKTQTAMAAPEQVVGSDEQSDAAQQNNIASTQVTAPPLSTAMLYDQTADKKWNKISSAQVNWSVLPLTTNAAGIREYAAKSDTLFAAQSLVAGIIIKKNHDKNLAASYILELRFKYTGSERNYSIADIDHIDLETNVKGAPQNIIISKFDDNYFGAALIIDDKSGYNDDDLMKIFQGINIILTRSDNQKFFIYIDKGETGLQAIEKVIAG